VPPSLPPADLPQLEAEARYHSNRLRLYHARVVSSKPTSLGELRELRRISEAADARLAYARTR
jgi:hypothetical protein